MSQPKNTESDKITRIHKALMYAWGGLLFFVLVTKYQEEKGDEMGYRRPILPILLAVAGIALVWTVI